MKILVTVEFGGSRTEGYLERVWTKEDGVHMARLTDREGQNPQDFRFEEGVSFCSIPVAEYQTPVDDKIEYVNRKNIELQAKIDALMDPLVQEAMRKPPAPILIDGTASILMDGLTEQIKVLKHCVWNEAWSQCSHARDGGMFVENEMVLKEIDNILENGKRAAEGDGIVFIDQKPYIDFKVFK